MKRILFIGDLRAHTRTSQRLHTMQRLGLDVTGISTVPRELGMPDGTNPSLLSRVRFRLGTPQDDAAANDAIVEAVRGGGFDLLWVEKAQVLRTSTLHSVRRSCPGIKLAFFSEDDMMARSNRSIWFKSSLPLYDVVFTTKSFNAAPEELPRIGAGRVIFSPKSFDLELHRPLEVTAADAERFGSPVGFIGTFESERAMWLLSLARAGIPVRVWGNGWGEMVDRHRMLRIENTPIYGQDYVRALCSTDINLGFLRKESRDQHTDRSIEIPACGAFMLAERTGEHQALFEEGVEAEFFGDLFELSSKVHRYLADPEARLRIGRAGRKRCIDSDYSHDAALRRMLAAVEGAARRSA